MSVPHYSRQPGWNAACASCRFPVHIWGVRVSSLTDQQEHNRLLADALAVIGDDWSFLILRQAFWGVTRFGQFMEALDVPRARLAGRLKYLVSVGIFEKNLYQDRPERYEYRLTPKGFDLHGAGLLIHQWADRWRSDSSQKASDKFHKSCGAPLEAVLQCGSCNDLLLHKDIAGAAVECCNLLAGLSTLLQRFQRRKTPAKHHSNFDPISYALEAFGDRWSLLILDCILGDTRRFDEIQARLSVARNILADRLLHLESEGLLKKRRYQCAPERFDYVPTVAAQDCGPIILSIQTWAQNWLYEAGSAPQMVHIQCGGPARPHLICKACREPLLWQDIVYSDPEIMAAHERMDDSQICPSTTATSAGG